MSFKSIFLIHFLALLFITNQATEHPSPSSIISRFQEYLRINTAQPNPKIPNYYEAAEFILSQAKSLSLESQTIEFVKNKPLILLKWPGKSPNLPSVLLNSHTDVVPVESQKWVHHPFGAHIDSHGNIHARGTQDMKSVGMQYLEAIRKLKDSGFEPTRTIYLSFVPDEEIGGRDGAEKLAQSEVFEKMNVAFVLDEGMPSPDETYRAYIGERSPMWLVIKATGAPGHGAKLYDDTAMENLLKSIESIRRFRASQHDMVKAGLKSEGEVISVNLVFLRAGTQTPDGFVMNLQPSEAEAGIDIRVPPTADQKSLEKRIAEEWAPASRNMTFEFKLKVPVVDKFGKPALTAADNSNPWWVLLEKAVHSDGVKLGNPELNLGTTDARYFRQRGLPAIGFSPIANAPLLLHDHNEGFVMNLQPSEAEAGFDIRVPPTADLESLEKRIYEEWAPVSRNMTFEFIQKDPLLDKFGNPILTVADRSNPWWYLFEEAIQNAGGKLEKPEILLGSTDASFFRQRGLPAIGFSAIANTPDRVHDHNEFLNQEEYLKGVDIYASIIKAYASYAGHSEAEACKYGL